MLNYLLAVTAGLLLASIHPGLDWAWLAPVALTPLVVALGRAGTLKDCFFLSWTAGIVFWAAVNYWIHFVMAVHGGLGSIGGFGVFVLFALLRGLDFILFGLGAGLLLRGRLGLALVPAVWVAMERIPWFFNYTWLTLGNAGIDIPWLARLAPVTGAYGISYVFALCGTALAMAILRRPAVQFIPLGLLLVVFAVPPLPDPGIPDRQAVALQPNLEEDKEYTSIQAETMQRRLEYLSLDSAMRAPKPELILWPEVPAPVYYYDDPAFRERLNTLARTTQTHVLIGTVASNERGSPLNSALMIDPRGEAAGRYDKMFLVPFGEYIPFPFSGLVQKITNEIGDFAPGIRVAVFPLNGQKIGGFICYESAFPELVRRFTAAGATVLANLSNDGYFGHSAARAQHLKLVQMRAVENARWVIRVTNDGVTASVDPNGKVREAYPLFKERAGRLSFRYSSELTPYVRYGDVFAWGCAAIAGVALAIRAGSRARLRL